MVNNAKYHMIVFTRLLSMHDNNNGERRESLCPSASGPEELLTGLPRVPRPEVSFEAPAEPADLEQCSWYWSDGDR